MRKIIIMLVVISVFICSFAGCNQSFGDQTKATKPGAVFKTEGKYVFLTWDELRDPENGEKFGYDARKIERTNIGGNAFRDCAKLVSNPRLTSWACSE